MGSETPLVEILSGLNESLLRNKNLFFYIFGNNNEINKIIFKNKLMIENSKIVDRAAKLWRRAWSKALKMHIVPSTRNEYVRNRQEI